ncbi:hypothetical protein M2232_005125 [Bradyrhizobium japonicum]|nr:hypothetical protein [Bradyrhizobium japonicum]MCW2346205.1 hypothetical protein [Bradyrhizobium japonicum]
MTRTWGRILAAALFIYSAGAALVPTFLGT